MIATTDLQSFKSGFRGQVLEPGDAGYHEARKIWNASIDKRPKMIARCSGAADVIDAVNFGRSNNLLTAIRGGGHNVGGRALCDDGLVIDLSRMRAVYVNPANSTVRVARLWVIWTAKHTSTDLPCLAASSRRPALGASRWVGE